MAIAVCLLSVCARQLGRCLLENVAIANALQLEAARRRAVPLRFNAKFVVAQPIRCRLRAFYCSYVTLHCDLEL